MARQYIDTPNNVNHSIDSYIPIFTILEVDLVLIKRVPKANLSRRSNGPLDRCPIISCDHLNSE